MDAGLPDDTFSGITVLDLSRLLPGPFCTQLLCDLGARVIKIEALDGGDMARWYPPMVDSEDGGYGAFFDAINRGKESVAINLKEPAGRELLLRLVAAADVLVEGFRPGVMDRLGLGADALFAAKPELIIARISGFGQDGPRATAAGHDLGFQAVGGALGLLAPVPGAPQVPAVLAADLGAGALQAAFAIAASLFRRSRTGEGADLDIAMSEGVTWMLSPMLQHAVLEGAYEPGEQMLTGGIPAYRLYMTSDGRQLAVAALEPQFWAGFCDMIGRHDLVFSGHEVGASGAEVIDAIATIIGSRPLAHWVEQLEGRDICVEPVKTWQEVINSAQAKARGSIRVEDKRLQIRVPGAAAMQPLRPSPRLGEHTSDVLRELGNSDDHLAALRQAKIIRG